MPTTELRGIPQISIRISKEDDNTTESVETLLDIVNISYAKAEAGLWKDSYIARVTRDELQQLISSKKLIVAEKQGRLVGCIKYTGYSDETVGLGMLAADPQCRGEGIGSSLLFFFEHRAIQDGYSEIQLELLEPHDKPSESKEFLKGWYHRHGYRPQRTESFSKHYDQADKLRCECDFSIWLKRL